MAGTSAQPWVSSHDCPRGKCNKLGMPMLILTCKRSKALAKGDNLVKLAPLLDKTVII